MDTKKIYLLVKIDGDIDFERKTILRAFTKRERAQEELEKLENKYFCNISWIDYIKMLNRFAVESTEIFDEEQSSYTNYTRGRLHIDDDLYLYMNKLLCHLYENMSISQIKATMLYYNKWRNELNSILFLR